MKIATHIVRVLLGFLFVVFGANKVLHFMPMPPMEGVAGQFMGALFQSHYLYVIAFCEIAGGALLLVGRFVPLGLVLLGPVVVNIFFFHLLMAPAGLPMAVIVGVLALFLLVRYFANFAGLLASGVPAGSRH